MFGNNYGQLDHLCFQIVQFNYVNWYVHETLFKSNMNPIANTIKEVAITKGTDYGLLLYTLLLLTLYEFKF